MKKWRIKDRARLTAQTVQQSHVRNSHDSFRKCHTNFNTLAISTKGHVYIRTVHAQLAVGVLLAQAHPTMPYIRLVIIFMTMIQQGICGTETK